MDDAPDFQDFTDEFPPLWPKVVFVSMLCCCAKLRCVIPIACNEAVMTLISSGAPLSTDLYTVSVLVG